MTDQRINHTPHVWSDGRPLPPKAGQGRHALARHRFAGATFVENDPGTYVGRHRRD